MLNNDSTNLYKIENFNKCLSKANIQYWSQLFKSLLANKGKGLRDFPLRYAL